MWHIIIWSLTKLFACVGGSGKEAEDEGEKTEDTEEEEEEGNEDEEGEEEEGGETAESQEEGEVKDGEVMIMFALTKKKIGVENAHVWCWAFIHWEAVHGKNEKRFAKSSQSVHDQ